MLKDKEFFSIIICEDEKMQRIAELREKAIMDEKAIYARGVDVGKEEGIQQGIEKGIKQGMEQGVEQGQKDKQIEIAKKMLEEKIDIEIIEKITKLSLEEIEKL